MYEFRKKYLAFKLMPYTNLPVSCYLTLITHDATMSVTPLFGLVGNASKDRATNLLPYVR